MFLDRDGTIAEEVGYLNHVSRFRMFPFVPAAIRRLNEAGFPVIVVTNQSGVGRGYFPESLVAEVHALMRQQLAAAGAHLTAVYYCSHTSVDNCECRKPKPGMMEQASLDHAIDLSQSFLVGDRFGDVVAADRAGAHSILVRTGYGLGELTWHAKDWTSQPEYIADDLTQAVDWILRQPK